MISLRSTLTLILSFTTNILPGELLGGVGTQVDEFHYFNNILSAGENSGRRDRKRRSCLRKLWPVIRGLSRRQLGLKLTNVAFPPVS